MSYDFNVYIKEVDDKFIKGWEDGFERFNMKCKVHPEFTFDNHEGFLPFKIIMNKDFIEGYEGEDLLSGFELYISDYKVSKDELEEAEDNIVPILKQAKKDILICISSHDSLEFRMGLISAAILSELCEGVVINNQSGEYYSKENIYDEIKKEIEEYEKNESEIGWELHPFEEWE